MRSSSGASAPWKSWRAARQLVLKTLTPAAWDALWNEVKSREKAAPSQAFSRDSSTPPYSGATVEHNLGSNDGGFMSISSKKKLVVSLVAAAIAAASAGAFAQDRYDERPYDQGPNDQGQRT